MANVLPPSNYEAELDACADELSKECAFLVLDDLPFISTFTMPTNDVVNAETINSVTDLAGSYLKEPMQDLKNQKQNLGVGENVFLDKETNLWMKSTNGKEVEDYYIDYRGGTGVFIPVSMNVEEAKSLKSTGVFVSTKSDHRAYDRKKKKGEKKKSPNYFKKTVDGTPTKSYSEALSGVCLPQEWPYEYST